MDKDRLRPFTAKEKEFAEENHDIIYKFLRTHGYSIEEYYNIVVFGYLKAVQNYLSRDDLMRNYCFSVIASNCMRREIGNYVRDMNRQKRKPLESILSLDAIYKEEYTDSLYNIVAGDKKSIESEFIELESMESLLNKMTVRQRNIIKLKLAGYSNKEVLEILDMVYSTYYKEIERIKTVLQCLVN